MKTEVFARFDQSMCPQCHKNKVDCYNDYDEGINYPELLHNMAIGKITGDDVLYIINNAHISEMRCRNCGTKYMIDNRLTFPRILSSTNSDLLCFIKMWTVSL